MFQYVQVFHALFGLEGRMTVKLLEKTMYILY
jgi:hypothetical protein